jgi:hypothetical protein
MSASRGKADLPFESSNRSDRGVAERAREKIAEDSVVSGRKPHVARSGREWHLALAAPVVLESSQR